MKITTKTTKEQLKQFINDNAKAVKSKDKSLFDRMTYTGKVAKEDDSKVTRKDLVDLAKETLKVLGKDTNVSALEVKETPATPVAENSVKKLGKGVSKKQKSMEETEPKESDEEEPADEVKEEKVDTKKSAKKSLGKKKDLPKKDGVTALEESSDKTVQLAKMFPQTIEVGDSKYEIAHDIKSMEDLHKALANDEEIVFAYYWTKRHLRQFPYFSGLLGQPKSFENDLDLATAIYVSDEHKVAYAVSMYYEALYTTIPSDFKEEDGLRINNGMEFQIYRAV